VILREHLEDSSENYNALSVAHARRGIGDETDKISL